MKTLVFICMVFFCAATVRAQSDQELSTLRAPLKLDGIATETKRISEAAKNSNAFAQLAELCDTFGPRLAGSKNLERAIDWIVSEMGKDGLRVRTEPVTITNAWRRGAELGELIEPRRTKLHLLGLGGTIPTPPEGITAEVVLVENLAEVSKTNLTGKIVLINQPFTSYGETVAIRSRGAIEAAKQGAVACLIRSVASFSMQTPHTGMMRYRPDVVKVPAAALSVEDAGMLARMLKRGQKVMVKLQMESSVVKAESRNVIGELPGFENPEEIVLIGGHIDSWDVGQGAMDDGGGCVATWEALRLIKQLGLHPKRTIRVVFWTNEENGVDGAVAYGRLHKDELAHHLAALETDQGVFAPRGFNFSGTPPARDIVAQLMKTVYPDEARKLLSESDDTDLYPLRDAGVPCFDLLVEREKYFWYHHTEADTVDKLDPAELNQCVAAIASLAYGLAEIPQSLR